ncbi:MAG TPA: hydrogen peroxide-inducible genes activator, partial [Rhizobiales bacterium]|nr:hydrogen peroxide-inducible genes activator [Hyphomicrobiales bacterium]
LLEEGHCFRDQAIEFCTASGLSKFSTLGATSLATVSQMVAANFGLTLLPQMAVERETAHDPGLTTKPFKPPQPNRTIGLIWRKNTPRLNDFKALGKVIKSTSI